MSKGFASSYRIVLLSSGLLLCLGALGVRLVFLHVIDREKLISTIVEARHQMIVEKARRGDLLDSKGTVLATSLSVVDLGVDPSWLQPKDEWKWPQLAALIGMPETELRRIFTTKFRAATATAPASATPADGESAGLVFNLHRPGAIEVTAPTPKIIAPAAPGKNATVADVDGEVERESAPNAQGLVAIKWVRLRDAVPEDLYRQIKELGIRGLTARRNYRRIYPNDQLASHLIGYVNHEQKPVAGMEAHADFFLRAQDGWRVGEKDSRGRELARFRNREVEPAGGYSVMLSIDATIQRIVEQELTAIADRYQPLKATIIVSDPRTGFILGMANYPTFNPNEYNKVPESQMGAMKNIAVTDIYEPGSVFKIVAASAALEERLVTPKSSFDCSIESIEFNGRKRSLPREDHNFGELTVAEIIAHSSNRGAAQLAMAVGEQKFYDYARAFGFGRRLGFPMGGEVGGTVHVPGTPSWDTLTITRMPMGQSVTCTALQMHQAMSVIAADGVLLRPQIIREITDTKNSTVAKYAPVEMNRVISPATARTMARLLMAVASKEGTAPEAAIPGYDVAGKTGTSQKYIDGKPSTNHHVASFIGFFPATARPTEQQVAISVIVDDADARAPNGRAYGSKVAAPSFKNIGEKLIPILKIKVSGQPAAQFDFMANNEGGRR